MSETRKLAAIMFTDIVGFTALMGADEQNALRVLAESRGLLQRLLPTFHGTLIGDVGDGALCSFQSALEAVQCARALQDALRTHPALHLRIGIHVGDVLFSAGDVIGDGVNVASRIHALAEPGGICVSEQVYDAIRNHPDIPGTFLGERRLRNVNRAIRVYVLSTGQTAAPGEHGPAFAGAPTAPKAAAEKERRQLTLVCCRVTVTGVAGRTPELEELDQVLRAQHAMCAELAGRRDGCIVSVMADRVLIAFGYPQAQEDDAHRAARTALEIAAEAERESIRLQAEGRLRLDVRIGVHTGLVVTPELPQAGRDVLGGIVGPTPQIAAALVERAGAGEVLVSDVTQRVLRGALPTEPAGTLDVRELPASVSVFRLTGGPRRAPGPGTIAPAGETPLVGRSLQLAELGELWARAQGGQPGAVFIRGEAGIGKSRLVRELRRTVPAEAWLECDCLVEDRETPLRPLVDLLARSDEPLESLLTRYGMHLEETVPLLSALLALPMDAHYQPPVASRERQKELTLQALLSLLLAMAAAGPRVLVVEDLHWADPTTLELTGLLLQELRTARALGTQGAPRLCLILTARPDFALPWSTDDASIMQLAPLDRREVEEMITTGLAHGQSVPPAVVEAIIEHADGIPLFVEEVTRALTESRALSTRGAPGAADPTSLQIPSSLRDLLAARLDCLTPSARETAQFAAVLGKEFPYELLRVVAGKAELALREDLQDLTAAGLVFHRRGARSESYVFKHTLIRDTAYEAMLRGTRRALHQQVAQVLRERFPEIEAQRPEILAQHLERSGDTAHAIEHWHRAGDCALKRAMYVEATTQLERGLALLTTLPASAARDRQEIELRTTLGTVLFSTRGHAAPEVEQTFARARELCERLGEDLSLKVLAGLASVYMARADRDATNALLPRFERLAARADDVVASITGHAVLGAAAFWKGHLVDASHHLAVAKQFYGTEEFKQFSRDYGYDGGFFIYPYSMSILWQRGYPDQADALRTAALTVAEQSGNAYSILIALGFAATLTHNLGRPEATLEIANRLMALATEQRLYFWSAVATLARGGALTQQGDAETAIALLTQGLDVCRALGLFASYGYYLTYLAAAYAQAGKVDEGLAVTDEGLARCQTDLTRFHESELHRLKGDLLVLQDSPESGAASYQRGIDVARQQSARSFELRATIGLSSVLRARGERVQARQLLADAYGWFTEGFDTKDLRTARALLAELT